MNLLSCIYYFGLVTGYRYWRVNRYYQKHPEEMQDFINMMHHLAILEPYEPWLEFAKQCQKSLDKYKNDLRRK